MSATNMIINYMLMVMITLVIRVRKQSKKYAEITMNIQCCGFQDAERDSTLTFTFYYTFITK